MDPVTLTEGDLLLRLPVDADVPQIVEACQDGDIQRWITSVPVPYGPAEATAFVGGRPARWADDEEYTLGVFDPEGARLLGMLGLFSFADGHAEVGYWTAPWARRQGVMTAAVRRTCRWGFEDLGLSRLEWEAAVGNDGSRRTAEKVGFVVEGVRRQRMRGRDGGRLDTWVGGLLPGELR